MNVAQITKIMLVISIIFAVLMVAFVIAKGKKQDVAENEKKEKNCDLYSFGSYHRSKWCHLCI